MSEQDYHYFASSVLNWTVNEDLEKCLRRQRLSDTKKESYQAAGCVVWRVPLHVDAHYSILDYAPQVEGSEVVARIKYKP